MQETDCLKFLQIMTDDSEKKMIEDQEVRLKTLYLTFNDPMIPSQPARWANKQQAWRDHHQFFEKESQTVASNISW
jgi:hypothetical protein